LSSIRSQKSLDYTERHPIIEYIERRALLKVRHLVYIRGSPDELEAGQSLTLNSRMPILDFLLKYPDLEY